MTKVPSYYYSTFRLEIMGVAMFSIMLFHQNFTSIPPLNFFHVFGHWGVDVFLFLSGMGLVNSIGKHSLKEYYQRRFWRLFPTCLLCGLLKFSIFIVAGEHLAVLRSPLHFGWWTVFCLDYWFIHTIIILYLLAPLFLWLLKRNDWLTFSTIAALSVVSLLFFKEQTSNDWFSPLGIYTWTIARTPVFLIGMLLNLNARLFTKRSFAMSTLFLLAAIILRLLQKYEIASASYLLPLLLALGTPSIIVVIIQIIKLLPSHLQSILAFTGRLSLELFLIHVYVFSAIFVLARGQQYPAIILLIIAFGLTFITACCCHHAKANSCERKT